VPERHRRKNGKSSSDEAGEERAGPRAFWSGTIAFGLVSVPVELYAANRPHAVSLRMLDEDGTPLARRYFCPKEERPLEWDEIVRGFEVEKEKYVVVTEAELEALEPKKSREIDLKLFVDMTQIEPLWFQRAYYLAPAEGSSKAYHLLARIMEDTGRAGIATFVMRGKEYLVAILAEKGILRAETLRFADEIRTPADVGLNGNPKPQSKDLTRMKREMKKLMKPKLDPDELHDEASARLLALVEKKYKAGTDVVDATGTVALEEEDEDGTVIDLMALLKERMQEGGGSRKSRTGRAASDALEHATKQELYERAKKLDIEGRSSMTRSQLIRAIREAA
jgi:DNA end-binding protein Ku